MRKTFLAFALLLLTFFSTKAQSTKPDCSNFNGGSFYVNTANETYVVYRGLEYWIYASTKDHLCLVYKIEWIDECNFKLHLNNWIDENKNRIEDSSRIYPYQLYYSLYSTDSSSITYKVRFSVHDTNSHFEKLHLLKDTIPWQYLIYADSNLYNDTTEIKKLYGKLEQSYYCNVPYFIDLETDSTETHFVDYIISLFQYGNIKPAFNYAAPNLQKHSPDEVQEDFNQYVEHLYGKLKSYSITSIKDGFHLNKNTLAHIYIIHGQFEKIPVWADLCVTTVSQPNNPLISMNVVVDSAKNIPYLDELSRSFWTLMKQKKHRKIYDSSASMLKQNFSFVEAEKNLNYIDSLGHLDDYKIYFQNFSVPADKGMVVLSYKCTTTDKPLFMNLIYIFENGEYKLAGVNAPKR